MPTRRQRDAEQRAAREAQEQRRAEAAATARARRRRLLLFGGAGVAVLAVAAVLVLVLSGSDETPTKPATPSVAERASTSEFDGIPQDGLVLGRPDAPYTLVEFGDLVCPGCKIYAEEILPRVITQYVKTGKLRFELRPFGFTRDWSTPAAQYAWAASYQNKLWEFVKAWYANQGDEDTDYVDDDFARSIGESVPGLDVEKLLADAALPATRKQLDDVARGFLTLGFKQAPAFAAGKTGEPVRPIDLGSSPQTASAAISQLVAR